MTDELIERLRDDGYAAEPSVFETMNKAADEIERLRTALEEIATGEGTYGWQAHEYKQIARGALKKEDD